MTPKRKKLIAIDGNSLLFRAFFALPVSIATRDGQPTNAVYGFATMLLKLLKEEKPDAVAVAWDRAAPTFRHHAFVDYKANRAAIPANLPSQFPLAKEVLEGLGVASFEIDGYEADDILAKLAVEAPAEGFDVLIVTGDKDALQLVNPHVQVMTTQKGITDTFVYDEARVSERFGVGPERVPDYLGLKGDSSDNIPGVPGVGDKTATELLQRFGTLDGIYEHVDEITKPKLKESLLANKEQAYLSRDLAVLQPDVPVDVSYDALGRHNANKDELRALFQQLEFKTLLNRLDDPVLFPEGTLFSGGAAQDRRPTPPALDIKTIREDPDKFRSCVTRELSGFELDDTEAGLRIVIVCAGGAAFWGDPEDVAVKEYMNSPKAAKVCHNLKDKTHLLTLFGIVPENVVFDTMLAAYLLDPGRRSYTLAEEVGYYLESTLPEKGEQETTAASAGSLIKLKEVLEKLLEERGLARLLYDVELPLSTVLAGMEAYGAAIDIAALKSLSDRMAGDLDLLEGEIYEMAGMDFNISSTQQLAGILFAKLGLKPVKKGKTGFSTDASVLTKLAGEHPIVAKILKYRELTKLKSTYLDALPKLVSPRTNRIHTYFNQVGTSTGRLASEKPNLQNIPVKGEWGTMIRAAFVPGVPGWNLMAADYSQIELRVLASLAEDRDMLRAFEAEKDIHTATAAEVLDVKPAEVTQNQRRVAKEINFGLMYGMSAYGLSQRLGIEPSQAEEYITTYFERYPAIREFIDKVINKAAEDGFVETVLGRRRYIPELKSSDFNVKRQGERFAINAVIQGSAADIIKVAMIKIDRDIRETGLRSRMFLQVHDELLFEMPPEEKTELYTLVKSGMESAYPLRAPLLVNIGVGKNWGAIDK
ncbi:MAG: DNA polymerase I [Actinomycetota bacterium]